MKWWSRVLTVIGALISITGVISLIWVQLTVHHDTYTYGDTILTKAVYRWSQVDSALALVAFGLLVAITAQIMGMMHAARVPPST